jgi:TRAP-type mannitol/chloroaromatic compound transport system permease small subunit
MTALLNLVAAIDRAHRAVARAAAWLVLVVVLLVLAVVVLRYGFAWGRIWLQESYLWLHAAAVVLAVAGTLAKDAHVRVDILYARAGPRGRAAVDLAGVILLLAPFALVLLWGAWPYARQSWLRLEASREAGGLEGVFLLKSLLVVLAVSLLLQGLVMAVRAAAVLGRGRYP